MQTQNLFEAEFVSGLFEEMAATYGRTNYVSSFGFCERWRRQCVDLADIKTGMTVYDLMTGMGECWHLINRKLRNSGSLVALDFCPEMCRRAEEKRSRFPALSTRLVQEDFLDNTLQSESADRIVSAFGLKTFSDPQKKLAASQIHRILKPGGRFSLLEISVPPNRFSRAHYLLYLESVIPSIGRIFLGNPDNYRLLGVYTKHFQNCRPMAENLRRTGLEVEYQSLFFGCASAVYGRKPMAT